MKNKHYDMKTKLNEPLSTGYNPKFELMTNSYSTKYFQESSAVKNTVAEIIKNKTILLPNITSK